MQQNAADAGFTGIVHQAFKVPLSPWPRDKKLNELGSFVGLYMDLSLDGFAVYPIGQVLCWSFEETQALVARMRAGIRSPKNMTTGIVYVSPRWCRYSLLTSITTGMQCMDRSRKRRCRLPRQMRLLQQWPLEILRNAMFRLGRKAKLNQILCFCCLI